MTYFSSETIKKASEKDQKRMKKKNFKMLQEKNSQPKIPFPAELSFKNEDEIKSFSLVTT